MKLHLYVKHAIKSNCIHLSKKLIVISLFNIHLKLFLRFKTKYRLKIHSDIHRGTPYVCPICQLQLSTRRTLRMHLVVHRDTKAFQCATCGKAFRRAKDLKVNPTKLNKHMLI